MERTPIFYSLENVPVEIKKKMAFYLDHPKPPNWRSLIQCIPGDIYNKAKIEEFAAVTLRPGGSPTMALIYDLEKRQIPLVKVVQWLKELSEKGMNTYKVLRLLIPLLGDSFGGPQVVHHPEDKVVIAGTELVLNCEATGQSPVKYQWFKEKILLPNQTSNQLFIPSATINHKGKYICRVSNCIGFVFTAWATVDVLANIIDPNLNLPVIIMHPNSCQLFIGEQMNMYCDAVGNPSPTFQWYKDDIPLKGETDRELIIDLVDAKDEGRYHCEVHNQYGVLKSVGAVMNILNDKKPLLSPNYEGRGADCFQTGDILSTRSTHPTGKLALLIGNQNYVHAKDLGELVHPRNDVRDVAGVLASIGFKVVTLVDLNLAEMKEAIKIFCNIVGKDTYAVFYFAGHGFEYEGESYIMPTDATSQYKRNENLPVSFLLSSMTSEQAKLNVLLLDCCRTTPMACKADPIPKLRDSIPVNQTNTVVCFGCCAQARVMECPLESNGFFAAQLIKYLGRKEKIDDVLFQVAKGMHSEEILDPVTGQKQIVYRLSTLVEELSLCDEPLSTSVLSSSVIWQEAHQLPPSPATVFQNKYVKVDISLVAEFSNVLLLHSNVSTHAVSQCFVQFLVPSVIGGAKVDVLRKGNTGKGSDRETVRISELQRLQGDLEIHIKVTYFIDGELKTGRALYSLEDRPLYARIVQKQRSDTNLTL